MTSDTPTPPAMTPEQRAELVTALNDGIVEIPTPSCCRREYDHKATEKLMSDAADKLEADGVTITKLTNELKLKGITVNMLDTAWDQSIEALAAAQAEIEQMTAALATAREDGIGPDELGFNDLVFAAKIEATKAMKKYPQPNYVISKFAEESGEVVKAAIHCAEGRETKENVLGEMKQAIAMLYRLYVEGDAVHGLKPLGEQPQITKGATT